jgi:hypothetical protein
VLYDDAAPYPNRLWYQGSTQYDYGSVTLKSDHSLRPAESIKIVQYFSVNNKGTATKNVETYTSVSPYTFKDGQLPLVVSGVTSGINLTEYEKTALTTLSQDQIPYTVVIPVTKNTHTFNLPYIVTEGYYNRCYNQTLCKNFTVQDEELAMLKQNTGTTGILPSGNGYNFDTLNSLSDNNYTYVETLSASARYGPYYREGIRNPIFAYVNGENTGIVLIPITEPSSSALDNRYDPDVFWSWNDTINTVRDYGGIAAFRWDPSDIGNPALTDRFENFLRNATSNGVTITTPDAVATHVRQLESVKVNVTRSEVNVILNARNTGEQPVSGISYEIIMPVFEQSCPYTITNGSITRYDIIDGKCRVYASFSLDAHETKEVKVAFTGTIKKLFPQIPELFQGKNTIRITDENNQPVKSASVRVGSKYYQSNNKGEVTFTTNFGERPIIIEKAGYDPVTVVTYVKPLFYRYVSFLRIR